jgi:two-component system, OmpR family, response regulator
MSGLLTVLVVENDPDNRAVIDVSLSFAGTIDARFAATVREAHAMIAADRYDCILLDPGMPDRAGLELLFAIAALDRPPPVMVVTANVDGQALDRYRVAGARKTVIKPFNPLTLASEVIALANGD